MSNFRELIVWQKARSLCLDVYRLTENFPAEERFGLTSQIRRSAVSVVSNIAEGADRGSDKENRQFLLMARGSLSELQTQLLIANDLELINRNDYNELANKSTEVHKMINGLLKSFNRNSRLKA